MASNEDKGKRGHTNSFSEKLDRNHKSFILKERQGLISAVMTEVKTMIGGYTDGQSKKQNYLLLITGIGGIAALGFFAYSMYRWDVAGTVSYGKIAIELILLVAMIAIQLRFGRETESPKLYFDELKEIADNWFKSGQK